MRTDSFSAIGSIAYVLTDWMSVMTGASKGFADTSSGRMRFASGDWATGIGVGLATPGLPFFERDSIGFSATYEYNISQRETGFSVDVTFGLSF